MRLEHGYASQRHLLDALVRAGIVAQPSIYAELESRGIINTPSRRKIAERIAAFYNEKMPAEPEPETGMGELVAGLSELVETLRVQNERIRDRADRQERMVEALVNLYAMQVGTAREVGTAIGQIRAHLGLGEVPDETPTEPFGRSTPDGPPGSGARTP